MARQPSPIERARAHFASAAPRPFDVPEWGITVHPKRENLTQRLARHATCAERGFDRANEIAYAIIKLATDEHGKPLFSPEDRQALATEADPDVLERIALQLAGVDAAAVEAAEKNS